MLYQFFNNLHTSSLFDYIARNAIVTAMAENIVQVYFILVLLFFLLLIYKRKEIVSNFKTVSKPAIIALVAIIVVCFYINLSNYEQYTHWDSEYGDYAKNAIFIIEGKQISVGSHSMLYSFLLAPFFQVLGIKMSTIAIYNAVMFALTTTVIFGISFLLFKNQWGAIIASIAYVLSPGIVFNMLKHGDFPTMLFFVALSFFFFFLYVKKNDIWLLALFLLSLLMTMHTRTNAVLLIPVFLLAFALYYKKIKTTQVKTVLSFLTLFCILLLPVLYTVASDVDKKILIDLVDRVEERGEATVVDENKYMLAQIFFSTKKTRDNFNLDNSFLEWHLENYIYLLLGLSLFFIRKYWKYFLIFWSYVIIQIIIYSNAITYVPTNTLQRFLLPCFIVFAIFIGLGANVVFNQTSRLKDKKLVLGAKVLASYFIIALLLLSTNIDVLIKPSHNNHQAGMDIDQACKKIPEGYNLVFSNSLYNTMYFQCYPYVTESLYNGRPRYPLNLDNVVFAYKEGIREDVALESRISKYETQTIFESQHVNLYKVIE